jgi:hypothetical protein
MLRLFGSEWSGRLTVRRCTGPKTNTGDHILFLSISDCSDVVWANHTHPRCGRSGGCARCDRKSAAVASRADTIPGSAAVSAAATPARLQPPAATGSCFTTAHRPGHWPPEFTSGTAHPCFCATRSTGDRTDAVLGRPTTHGPPGLKSPVPAWCGRSDPAVAGPGSFQSETYGNDCRGSSQSQAVDGSNLRP